MRAEKKQRKKANNGETSVEPIVVLKRTSHKIAKSVSILIKKVRAHT